jgi:hypothetical protein
MEIEDALKIMRALANGTNPETGEALEAGSVCRRPQTVKALNRAISALVEARCRESKRPMNAFRTWTRAEDAQVCEEVRKGMDFHEIAKAHNRTVPSIVARLVKLGKIAPERQRVSSPNRAA